MRGTHILRIALAICRRLKKPFEDGEVLSHTPG